MRIMLLWLLLAGPLISVMAQPFENSEFAEVEGVKLHYRKWEPQQPPKAYIFFIHGFVSSTYTWRNNAPALADSGYYVMAVDLPSFGYSQRVEKLDHSPVHLAKLLWKLLDKVKPDADEWHIAAHSSSGNNLIAMYQHRPAQTGHLVLTDGTVQGIASSSFYDAMFGFFRFSLFRKGAGRLASVFLFNEDIFQYFLAGAYLKLPPREVVQNYLKPFEPRKHRRMAFDLFNIKKNIDIESLYKNPPEIDFIWGKRDIWIPPNVARKYIRRVGSGELHLISKAGHTPMETHPQEFNEVLISILKNDD